MDRVELQFVLDTRIPDLVRDVRFGKREKKGTVNATITGEGKEILESRWSEDENAMLYPVYTPCQMMPENCVVFGLNYANAESGSEVMTARLVPDKDQVQIDVVSILPAKFPFSSCLVFLREPANRLFFLGGGHQQLDALNTVNPRSFQQFTRWDFKSFKPVSGKWETTKCAIQIKSLYSRCFAFKDSKNPNWHHIAMIGGEDGETEDPNKSVHHLVFDDKTNQLWYYNSKSDQAPGCADSNSTDPNQQTNFLPGVKGLKEFATGILNTKDDKKINIVAAGGKINGTVFRQILILQDFSQKNSSKSSPEKYSFPLARHSASSVVVPTAFFAGMNCSIKAEGKNSARELTSGIGILIFILAAFFL